MSSDGSLLDAIIRIGSFNSRRTEISDATILVGMRRNEHAGHGHRDNIAQRIFIATKRKIAEILFSMLMKIVEALRRFGFTY